jgi:hypothetical protein
MAEVTFNREAGAAPAGITRFRQFRTTDGSNVTINSFRSFAGDGSYPLADVYEITFGTSGTASFSLAAGNFAARGYRIYDATGVLKGSAEAPKTSRRLSADLSFSVTSGDTATVYVDRSDRSSTEYRLTVTAA